MSKYSRELKIIIANQYLLGESSTKLSKKYSIPARLIRYWSQVVAIHGDEAFQPTPHLRCAKARLNVLNLMLTNNWSFGHTSAVLNLISPGILFAWRERYNKNGLQGLEYGSGRRSTMKQLKTTANRSDDEKTLKELKEEVAYLRAENAVLKKLEELKQIKRQQAKKKH